MRLRRRKVSESLCFKHNKHHVYSESECPWCEIDWLKAGLESSELSRATLSGLYHDLQCQLAEVKHELKTTQLYLMEEETTRKIWEQDCKKAESQLAELQQLQVEIVESVGATQQHLLAQLAEARAEVERQQKEIITLQKSVIGLERCSSDEAPGLIKQQARQEAARECLEIIRSMKSCSELMEIKYRIMLKFGLEG
jgi:hypothetical protein